MVVTYINRQNKRYNLSSEVTNYILPNSGYVNVKDIKSQLVYVNGDSYEIEKGTLNIPIEEKSIELEVDNKKIDIHVLCRKFKDEIKLDYNALGIVFNKNLVEGKMNEKMLFDAIEEEGEEFKIPLCTFNRKFESITKDYDLKTMSECIDRLPHIFLKPRQHLKQVNEVRPAAIVSRIGQESISYLASHSEHWKGIKANGLIPERLLARTLEDDYAIYENIAVKIMVDRIYKEMKVLSEETIDCYMQMDIDDGHTVSGEQKIYFHARDILLKGMDDDSVEFNQLLLEEQREYISKILEKLKKCRSTPLYRTLKNYSSIDRKLKKTNIFMMDKYYKYAYKLWELVSDRQKVKPYDPVKNIEGEYDLFCKILFLFALKYFQFEQDVDSNVFCKENFEKNIYTFNNWHIEINNHIMDELDVNGFDITMYMNDPIKVKVNSIDISKDVILRFDGVQFKNDTLIFKHSLEEKEQEELIKALKISWPSKKQKNWSAELKQKMYAAFSNNLIEKRSILFVPWKYIFPDNVEDMKQTFEKIKENIDANEYDMVYILTATRPNEFVNIKDKNELNKMIFYGKANVRHGLEKSKYGFIPIGLNDINSYRRYTKILLEQMISLDHDRKVCPICGGKLNIGAGSQSNIASCHECGFQIIDTKCSKCKKEFTFTRYTLPKTTTKVDIQNNGFKVISNENKFGFKNITEVFLEDNQIHPLCPYCGE